MECLGIDVGGSGIKGAIVDTSTGELITERLRISTPKPSLPASVADCINQIVQEHKWDGPVGCSFPAIIRSGVCMTASNIHKDWMGTKVNKLFSKLTGNSFYTANDADLAGLAEMRLGAGKGKKGKVLMLTIGTGIGSGFFIDGKLIPNIEMGFIPHTDGKKIESYAADSARKKEDLGLQEWADRFNYFLKHVARIFDPDLVILGGGISKKFEKFQDRLTVKAPIKVAKFRNNAGIIGAAILATEKQ